MHDLVSGLWMSTIHQKFSCTVKCLLCLLRDLVELLHVSIQLVGRLRL